jgi:hypothetical protein
MHSARRDSVEIAVFDEEETLTPVGTDGLLGLDTVAFEEVFVPATSVKFAQVIRVVLAK